MALPEALMSLAAAAGSGLVGAATTDMWNVIKDGFTRLLAGDNPRQVTVIEGRLEETRAALQGAASGEIESLRAKHEQAWELRLSDLLEERPDLAPALQELVGTIQAGLGGGQVSAGANGLAVGGNLTNTASSGGVSAGVINGGVTTSNPSPPSRPLA